MKLIIKKVFKDKHTGTIYEKVGKEVDFKKARAEELLADERELVAEVDKDAPPAGDEANADAESKE